LKEWLYKNGYQFNTRPFDTEAQTEFIMKNMFGNPPILQFTDKIVSAEDIFPNDKIDEMKIYEVLSIDEA
jgi:hypothetical protein